MTKFVELRAKTHSKLVKRVVKIRKQKGTKNCVVKRKLKFKNYKNCLVANQLENKINNRGKNNIAINNLLKSHKEFIRKIKLILKTQQWFKTEKQYVFTEKVSEVALSSNDDKRMQ